jgi:hypothetical protein
MSMKHDTNEPIAGNGAGPDIDLKDIQACIEAADVLVTEWIATGRTDHMEDAWQDLRYRILHANIQMHDLRGRP